MNTTNLYDNLLAITIDDSEPLETLIKARLVELLRLEPLNSETHTPLRDSFTNLKPVWFNLTGETLYRFDTTVSASAYPVQAMEWLQQIQYDYPQAAFKLYRRTPWSSMTSIFVPRNTEDDATQPFDSNSQYQRFPKQVSVSEDIMIWDLYNNALRRIEKY